MITDLTTLTISDHFLFMYVKTSYIRFFIGLLILQGNHQNINNKNLVNTQTRFLSWWCSSTDNIFFRIQYIVNINNHKHTNHTTNPFVRYLPKQFLV